MAVEATDGTPVPRLSDFRRLNQQFAAIDRAQRALEARVSALEATAANLRADVVAGYDLDRELGVAIDEMLRDMAACRPSL